MWSFPSLEPVILDQRSFVVERALPQPGEVLVTAGQTVTPDQVVAHSDEVERTLTLYVASELGLDDKAISKYVVKSVGSQVAEGEVIARVRRGLRTAAVKSPTSGTLVAVDEANGTIIMTASMGKRELLSLVSGQVEQIVPERGALVRTTGTRVYGIAGFGTEAIGTLAVASDRPDRELTSDNVSTDWRGGIVLAGMTAGVPALTRLKEVGAAGVIMGSISEGDIRRFLAGGQIGAAGFWVTASRLHGHLAHPGVECPFVIVVTEGFGRRAMSEQLFDLLRQHQGERISVCAGTNLGGTLARPEIYIEGDAASDDAAVNDAVTTGRVVRLVDSGAISVAGTVVGDPYTASSRYGVGQIVADIELESGEVRTVPLSNIEVIA